MSDSGIGALRARRVPAPLHPRVQKEAASEVVETAAVPNEAIPYIQERPTDPPVARESRGKPRVSADTAKIATPSTNTEASAGARRAYRSRPAEDQVPLGVRVRRDLDNKLIGLSYKLRLQNVRASKADLVALAIQDLPADPTAALIRSLERHTSGVED